MLSYLLKNGGGDACWSVGNVHGSGIGVLCGNKEIRIEDSFTVVQGRVMCVDIKKKKRGDPNVG